MTSEQGLDRLEPSLHVGRHEGMVSEDCAVQALLVEGEIGKLQDALRQRGYLAQHRAGELDDPTTDALRKFQRDQGLAETGFPDRLTLQELGIDPEAAYGKVSKEGKGGSGEGSAGDGNTSAGGGDGARRGEDQGNPRDRELR